MTACEGSTVNDSLADIRDNSAQRELDDREDVVDDAREMEGNSQGHVTRDNMVCTSNPLTDSGKLDCSRYCSNEGRCRSRFYPWTD